MFTSALLRRVETSLSPKFRKSFSLQERPVAACMPSGVQQVEFPRGTLAEIYGPASSGKTGLVYAALARATRVADYCALVDAGDSFDPVSGRDAGIDLNQLLWVRCANNAEHALKAADLVLQAGGFAMVVLDLAGVPASEARRISLTSWFRLRHAAEKCNAAFVVVEEERNAGSCSTLQVETKQAERCFEGALLHGLRADAVQGPRIRSATPYSALQRFGI